MPRISLWKEGKHTNDYQFFDRIISEQFTVGGTGIHVHKYLGPAETSGSTDPTQPDNSAPTELDIQDILFMENRDRKYDADVYNLRGIYRLNDSDFDLSQFGLFLSSDTIFIVFHLKDMYDAIGRKLMPGDVLELPHLKEFYALDEDIPAALRRYYVVQEGTRPAEGYSPSWWPHLWRVKCTPLVDSQEVSNLLEQLGIDGKPKDDVLADTGANSTLADILSNNNAVTNINEKIIEQAENDVPKSGYDTSHFYVAPVEDGHVRRADNLTADSTLVPGTSTPLTADNGNWTADSVGISPDVDIQKSDRYLIGDGLAPNGYPVIESIEFPSDPKLGDFVLRIDFIPNRLFRFDGNHWIKIEDKVRTSLTAGNDETLLGGFVNNNNTSDGEVTNRCTGYTEERQLLSEILKPKADN